MYATLTDRAGNRTEVEVLEASQRTLHREDGDELVPVYLTRYEFESPRPIDAPAAYQLELASGELIEVQVALCLALGEEVYFVAAHFVDDEPGFGGISLDVDARAFAD